MLSICLNFTISESNLKFVCGCSNTFVSQNVSYVCVMRLLLRDFMNRRGSTRWILASHTSVVSHTVLCDRSALLAGAHLSQRETQAPASWREGTRIAEISIIATWGANVVVIALAFLHSTLNYYLRLLEIAPSLATTTLSIIIRSRCLSTKIYLICSVRSPRQLLWCTLWCMSKIGAMERALGEEFQKYYFFRNKCC